MQRSLGLHLQPSCSRRTKCARPDGVPRLVNGGGNGGGLQGAAGIVRNVGVQQFTCDSELWACPLLGRGAGQTGGALAVPTPTPTLQLGQRPWVKFVWGAPGDWRRGTPNRTSAVYGSWRCVHHGGCVHCVHGCVRQAA
jgi:hypothetical protein